MGGIVVNFVQSVIAWFGRQERQLRGERKLNVNDQLMHRSRLCVCVHARAHVHAHTTCCLSVTFHVSRAHEREGYRRREEEDRAHYVSSLYASIQTFSKQQECDRQAGCVCRSVHQYWQVLCDASVMETSCDITD